MTLLPLATISWLQKTYLLHPTLIVLIGIISLLIFWLFVIAMAMNTQNVGGMPDRSDTTYAGVGLLIGIVAFASFIFSVTNIDKKDIYNNQQLNVTKVTHVQGTKNYLVTTKDNQKYNFSKNNVTINTANKASAKVTKSTPKSDLDNKIIKAYEKKHKRPENKLTINLTPQMKDAKAEEWTFN